MLAGDSLYLPLVWQVYTTKGKLLREGEFLTDKAMDDMINNNAIPSKLGSKLKINKPGKYRMGVAFLRMVWNGNDFNAFNQNTDIDTKVKTITVYGTVKFSKNAKNVKLKTTKKLVKNGAKYGKLPKPTKKGKKFIGWFTKKKGGTKITSKSKVSMTKATKTLYAHWKNK